MWIIRFVMLGLLAVCVGLSGHLLRRREKYGRLLESGPVNLVVVVLYNLLCYLTVGLPSDQSVLPPPAFFTQTTARVGLSVLGHVLIVAGVLLLLLIAVMRRKTLGGQDVEEGLLTSGIYRYFWHPMYTGIVWIALTGILLALAGIPYLVWRVGS
jgi:protein-S-isoprenylcysteine O-methyltransferase Ste14